MNYLGVKKSTKKKRDKVVITEVKKTTKFRN